MIAVAILLDVGASCAKGRTVTSTVARTMIQVKKENGRGVTTSSRCMRAVARSAAPNATNASCHVVASPRAPSRSGASTGMSNNTRVITTPTA
jgi:hypothetical protein